MSKGLEIYPYKRENESEVIKNNMGREWGKVVAPVGKKKRIKFKGISLNFVSARIFCWSFFLFLFARGELVGGLRPFLPALFAAAFIKEKRGWPLFFASSALGLWFELSGHEFIINLSILILISVILLLVGNRRDKPYIIPISVALGVFIAKIGFSFLEGYVFYRLLSIVFEGLLAGSLVPSFLEVLQQVNLRKKKIWTKGELLGLSLLFFGILVSTQDLFILEFSIGGFLSRYLVLLLAYNFGPGVSTGAGVIVGIAPGVTSVVSPQMVGVYALSGFLSGLFQKMGKLTTSLGFLLGHFLLSVYVADPWDIEIFILETSIAIAAFLITPAVVMKKFRVAFSISTAWSSEETDKEMLVSKVNELGRIFKELSRTFKQISVDAEENEYSAGAKELLKSIAARTCSGCAVFGICWERDLQKTYSYVMDMFRLVKAKGEISSIDIPYEIRKRCQRTQQLTLAVNSLYDTYRLNKYWQKKLQETRQLVSEQLNGVSYIMDNLAGQIRLENNSLQQKEVQFFEGLKDLGINVEGITLSELEGGTEILIEKEPCRGTEMECTNLIKPFAGEFFNENFVIAGEECGLKHGNLSCHCRLLPSGSFTVEVGYAAAAGGGNSVIGDSYWYSFLKGGKYIILLSDGMGVGTSACRESNATVMLLQQLLNNGFDTETAIKTVNSLLSMRSTEETFATVDLTVIDLTSGGTEFTKIGAAPSFIKRGNVIGTISSPSLPIGILNKVDVQTVEKKLRAGDILVMVTDGVLEGNRDIKDKEKWMRSVLKEIEEGTAQEMSELILRHALAVIDGPVKDDMSVIVAKVKRGS